MWFVDCSYMESSGDWYNLWAHKHTVSNKSKNVCILHCTTIFRRWSELKSWMRTFRSSPPCTWVKVEGEERRALTCSRVHDDVMFYSAIKDDVIMRSCMFYTVGSAVTFTVCGGGGSSVDRLKMFCCSYWWHCSLQRSLQCVQIDILLSCIWAEQQCASNLYPWL